MRSRDCSKSKSPNVAVSLRRALLYRGDELDGGGIVVREEGALALVKCGDLLHVALGQREVEHLKILLHALFVRGLGNDDHAALDEKSERDLRGRLLILLTDLAEDGIGEEVLSSFGEGAPALMGDAVLVHPFAWLCLLLKDVRLHLVDHGLDVDKLAQVDEAVGVEVGYADRAQLACPIGLLHGAPCPVVVAEGLVNEQQVDVVRAQLFQRRVDGRLCPFIACVGDPYLRRQKELVARNSALLDRAADRFFVVVCLCRVDRAIADRDRVKHAPLALLVADLIDAVAEDGHFDTVCQSDILHCDFLLFFLSVL